MQSAVSGEIKAWCDVSDVTSPSNNRKLNNVTKDYNNNILYHPNNKAGVKKRAVRKRNYLDPFVNLAYSIYTIQKAQRLLNNYQPCFERGGAR